MGMFLPYCRVVDPDCSRNAIQLFLCFFTARLISLVADPFSGERLSCIHIKARPAIWDVFWFKILIFIGISLHPKTGEAENLG